MATIDDKLRARFGDHFAVGDRLMAEESSEPLAQARWVAGAEVLLTSVFGPAHSLTSRFKKSVDDPTYKGRSRFLGFHETVGVFGAACEIVERGEHKGILDAVRAETVLEVLEQAEVLLCEQLLVAATVLAGGALETHLHHLCETNGITWSDSGSIGKYNNAISKARKDGVVNLYDATTAKQVTTWGGMRNDAAHGPTSFNRDKADVRRMLEGIQDFIVRTT